MNSILKREKIEMEMRIGIVEVPESRPLMMRWMSAVGSKMSSSAEVPLSLDYLGAILRWHCSCMQRS